jgi:glucose/arabinose dehydrogenase
VEFDDLGLIYVAESGASYGDEIAPARILRFDPLRPNQRQVVAEQLSGPVTDILWHQGRLYISQRGKISVLLPSGPIVDLVQGLPSLGNHPNGSLAVGPDGKIYFGQGTATNSGIVGFDNFQMGWLQKYPEVHDIPAHDIRVRGQAIQTPDPLTFLRTGQAQTVMTSAFQPFGSAVQDGTMLAGQVKSNGTILRMNPDGSNLEVYAWGLRNPFGIGFLPDGRLLATDAGYDDNGSRPIANAPDVLWNIRAGAWYGFPDFAAGIPVTDPRFRSTRGPAPEFLLAEHPPVETPLATLPPHTVATKFDLSPGGAFGNRQLYLALFGDLAPTTGEASQHPGSSVSRLDMNTQEVVPFLRTKRASLGPPGFENAATAGLKRPIDAKFSPDGSALYVVDFGAIATVPSALGARPRPFPGTGALWRITATGMTAALPSGTRRTFFRGPQVYQGVQLPVSSSVYTLDGTYLYPPVWHYDPTGTLVP